MSPENSGDSDAQPAWKWPDIWGDGQVWDELLAGHKEGGHARKVLRTGLSWAPGAPLFTHTCSRGPSRLRPLLLPAPRAPPATSLQVAVTTASSPQGRGPARLASTWSRIWKVAVPSPRSSPPAPGCRDRPQGMGQRSQRMHPREEPPDAGSHLPTCSVKEHQCPCFRVWTLVFLLQQPADPTETEPGLPAECLTEKVVARPARVNKVRRSKEERGLHTYNQVESRRHTPGVGEAAHQGAGASLSLAG